MAWVVTAVVGSAVIGGVASKMGSDEIAGATKDAAKATAAATADTNALLQKQYEQTRTDQEPWRVAGEKALQTIQDTPDFQFTPESFEQMKDPAYQFRMDEGINALDRSAASRGRVLSGAQDRAVTRYGSNLASQEYGNAFNRAKSTYQQNLGTQQSLAGIGQQATNITSQAGQQTAANMGQNIQQSTAAINALNVGGAQATAQGYQGAAQAANQATGNFLLYDYLQKKPATTGA